MNQRKVDKEVRAATDTLFANILPKDIDPKTKKKTLLHPKTRQKISKESGISDQTLRTARQRGSMNVDTLLRILYARGADLKKFVASVKTKKFDPLLPNEAEWLRFGMKLSEKDRGVYLDLVKCLEERWKK